jgi:hypothetical protein
MFWTVFWAILAAAAVLFVAAMFLCALAEWGEGGFR